MSTTAIVSRAGTQGAVETAKGPRPGTPQPKTPEGTTSPVIRAASAGAGAAVLSSGEVRPGTPQPKILTTTAGRRRHRGGRKTQRRRRHRGGGLMMVVQDGSVWRLKEDLTGPDGQQVKDAAGNIVSAYSEESWNTFEEATRVANLINQIKRADPTQEGRAEIVSAGKTLVTMKKRGGRRTSDAVSRCAAGPCEKIARTCKTKLGLRKGKATLRDVTKMVDCVAGPCTQVVKACKKRLH